MGPGRAAHLCIHLSQRSEELRLLYLLIVLHLWRGVDFVAVRPEAQLPRGLHPSMAATTELLPAVSEDCLKGLSLVYPDVRYHRRYYFLLFYFRFLRVLQLL